MRPPWTGPENKGFYCVMQELPQERLLIGDMGVAAAEAVFEWTKDYTMDRKAFGGSLSGLPTLPYPPNGAEPTRRPSRARSPTCRPSSTSWRR